MNDASAQFEDDEVEVAQIWQAELDRRNREVIEGNAVLEDWSTVRDRLERRIRTIDACASVSGEQGAMNMASAATAHVDIEVNASSELARLRLPEGVDRRLHALLDKQDGGEELTADEQAEAEGLVELAEVLTLLRLRLSRPTAER